MIKLTFISDTHNNHESLSVGSGDFLIHTGDFTEKGRWDEFYDFVEWFAAQDFKHKILLGGNHDRYLLVKEHDARVKMLSLGITYLNNSAVTIEGLKFFGSPHTIFFGDFDCFQMTEEEFSALTPVWPQDADVYLFHGPPQGRLDENKGSCGSRSLRNFVDDLPLDKNRLVAFGHIHQGFGNLTASRSLFINAAQFGQEINGPLKEPVRVLFAKGEFVLAK
jgi:Icc-related predicted phosphoesterase